MFIEMKENGGVTTIINSDHINYLNKEDNGWYISLIGGASSKITNDEFDNVVRPALGNIGFWNRVDYEPKIKLKASDHKTETVILDSPILNNEKMSVAVEKVQAIAGKDSKYKDWK